VDERKLRLEALREAILQGRYHVTEDALARAILRAAGARHDRRV
jgi:anti-sigma28 factor (negative regulator of flagellin synthesis)